MAGDEFPSPPSSPPPATPEPAAGAHPLPRTDARPGAGADGPVGTWPTTRHPAPEGDAHPAARYAQPAPRGTAPRVGQGRNTIHADAHAGAAYTHAPAATQQPAFRRYPVGPGEMAIQRRNVRKYEVFRDP